MKFWADVQTYKNVGQASIDCILRGIKMWKFEGNFQEAKRSQKRKVLFNKMGCTVFLG